MSKFPAKIDTNGLLKPFTESGFEVTDLEAMWIDDFGAFVVVKIETSPEDIISKIQESE